MMKTIAIFHGLGDCVNATSLIIPIKNTFPNHKLLWVSSSKYISLIYHNPYVDEYLSIDGDEFTADSEYNFLKRKYNNLICPAPYLNPPSKNNLLLESFEEQIQKITGKHYPLQPLLYLTNDEIESAHEFIYINNIKKFIILECKFTSSQSFIDNNHIINIIKLLGNMGYTVLLAHRNDVMLEHYRKFADVHCIDLHYRIIPALYNKSCGFIGVSSGISCIVHTNQCRKDIPHIEYVRGEHWCTRKYHKNNKIISFNNNMDNILGLVKKQF